MSLDYKNPGNPAMGKGHKLSTGKQVKKEKKLEVRRRLRGVWKTHPVDKMVKIANFLEVTNPEFAAKIWIRLLDSCELEENKKRSSMPPPIADYAPETDSSALELLEEMEKNDKVTPESSTDGMEIRPTKVQVEASPEADLRSDPQK